jgi:cytoskeletal protein RodZ
MSAKFRLAMTGLIVLSAFTGCSEEDTPSPPPSVVTVTETASPTPSSTAHPSASTSRSERTAKRNSITSW